MATVNAATCSSTDVQTAINTAVTGDTVEIPAGNCTWTTAVTFPTSGKNNVKIHCDSPTTTVITVGVSAAIQFKKNSGVRLTNCGFKQVSSGIDNWVTFQGQNFRVDHSTFTNTFGLGTGAVAKHAIAIFSPDSATNHPTGVVDNNTFYDSDVIVQGGLQSSQEDNNIWFEASTIGAATPVGVVYVETNTFIMTPAKCCAIDSNTGGRYVFRYNTVTNSDVNAHSVQGKHRAARSWEIYNNTFNATSAWQQAIYQRGGTGVIFSNTITGSYSYSIIFDNRRSNEVFTATPSGPGSCAGSSPENSYWDGNTTVGWPCRDQIGRGVDASLWDITFSNPAPLQASEPAYIWSNTKSGVATTPTVAGCSNTIKTNGSCADIVLNRDYFNSTLVGYTAFAYPYCYSGVGPGSGTGCDGDTPIGTGHAALNQTSLSANWIVGIRPGTAIASDPASIVLTNDGTGVLTINSISISGNTKNFVITTNTCGATLAASASCTIGIEFTPHTAGVMTQGTLTVDTDINDPTCTLDGTGLTIQQSLFPGYLA